MTVRRREHRQTMKARGRPPPSVLLRIANANNADEDDPGLTSGEDSDTYDGGYAEDDPPASSQAGICNNRGTTRRYPEMDADLRRDEDWDSYSDCYKRAATAGRPGYIEMDVSIEHITLICILYDNLMIPTLDEKSFIVPIISYQNYSEPFSIYIDELN